MKKSETRAIGNIEACWDFPERPTMALLAALTSVLLWQRDSGVGSVVDWEVNYGMPLNAAASTSVPEPSTFALALAVLCLPGKRRC